jgi:chloramphenicol O-acetyltransferase type A
MSDTIFTPIDLETWPRKDMFYVYTKLTPSGYSVTVDMDVTELKRILNEKNMKFFPAFIWTATRAVNYEEGFRVAYKDGVLGMYDKLVPLYPTFHKDDNTDSLMWASPCSDSFNEFYYTNIENQKRYGENHGPLSIPGAMPPANGYNISCIPWISFNHFSLHMYVNGGYFFPVIESGKYRMKQDKLLMPVSITVHHATADGWHVSRFFNNLQDLFNCPEEWIG